MKMEMFFFLTRCLTAAVDISAISAKTSADTECAPLSGVSDPQGRFFFSFGSASLSVFRLEQHMHRRARTAQWHSVTSVQVQQFITSKYTDTDRDKSNRQDILLHDVDKFERGYDLFTEPCVSPSTEGNQSRCGITHSKSLTRRKTWQNMMARTHCTEIDRPSYGL